MNFFLLKIYWKLLLLIKYCPYNCCSFLRMFFCKNLFKSMGNNCHLTDGVTLSNPKNISFGQRVSVHQYSLLDAQEEIIIGNNVAIGSHVSIITSSHNFNDNNAPIKEQGTNAKKIIVSDNVWIGNGVTILQGVTIGENSIIGAKSLVNKDIPKNVVAFGIPCKVIKKRT